MKITKSQDGIPRISLKLESRLSAYDLAVHLMNRLQYDPEMSSNAKDDETTADRDLRLENAIKSKMASLSQKEMLDLVRDSVLISGEENPHYTVSDGGYATAVDFLTGYLTRKYKGFR